MHLVFVTSLVPVKAPRSGYDIANRVIVDALRLAGHRVSVLGFLQPGNKVADAGETHLLGALEVTNARSGRGQKARWLARAFVNGEPVSVAKMHAASREDIRNTLAAIGKFDALVLNSVQLPGAFLDVFAAWPYVFVAHNVEARSAVDNAANAGSLVKRLLFEREARLLSSLEARLCGGAAHVFTLAEADRAELGVDAPGRSTALPLVTSVEAPEAPRARQVTYDFGLIGSWTWAANRAGLDWFLENVVPLLPADATIAVAGDTGGPVAASANVSFLGRVPDARAFVRSVGIVPLVSRTGTGVQLKTIETFEMGLPAVATANALRGIADIPRNCSVADDPEAFAAALMRVATAVKAGQSADLDGRGFHRRQRDALVSGLQAGLSGLAAREEASAFSVMAAQ